MTRMIISLLAALLLTTMTSRSQTYQQLWKQVEQAQEKDLPKTAIDQLGKISRKARKEQAYGQLLKASLLQTRLQGEVSPDSLEPALLRIEQEANGSGNEALKAVWYTVLSKVYEQCGKDYAAKATAFHQKAIAQPNILARTQAGTFEPFVIKGKDSKTYYGDDLLSIIGTELGEWRLLHDHYSRAGNRQAACLTGANAFDTIGQLDSLTALYGDLPEACELAIVRYQKMKEPDYPLAQRMDYLRDALRRWGTWQRANVLRNIEQTMTTPTFQAEIPHRVAMPGESQTIALTWMRNIESLTMNVYKTSLKGDAEVGRTDLKKLVSKSQNRMDLSCTLQFHGHKDYEHFKDSLLLPGLEPGVYLIEFSAPNTESSYQLYYVSGVHILAQPMPEEQMRLVVVDARTGQPLSKSAVNLIYYNGNKPRSVKLVNCDSQGEATLDYSKQRPSQLHAFTTDDAYTPTVNAYGRYSFYQNNYGREQTCILTDRAIYRPGQTVHVAAIVWMELSPTDHIALADKRVTIELRDANYKQIGEQQVTTDRYGKCHADFTLPTGLLNGHFTVRAGGHATSIRVEEYKRPTFQVEFQNYKESYKAGDTVQAVGKAVSYAGVPLQGAKVRYTVKRRVAFWWLSYSWYWQHGYAGRGMEEEIVNEGEATTADDGTFHVDMPLELPDDSHMFYHFTVEAGVTDQGGETHSGTLTLPLGSKPTALTCNMPQQVRSDQMPPVTFTRRNTAGQEISGQVRYRIDGKKWKQCEANAPVTIFNSQFKSGSHRLEAICEQDTIDTNFIVFSLTDTKPATETKDWFYVSDKQFPRDGTPVTLQVGSSDPDLHIVYGIFAGNKVIESGTVEKNGELINRQFTFKEEYGDGLLITYAWVKDGECYSHQQTLKRPMPDKKLRMVWTTFRDRLTPGQQEKWRLTIKNPDGTPADASLLAVLYDKSLDQLYQHQWHFEPSAVLSTPNTHWMFRRWGSLQWYGAQRYRKPLPEKELTFSCFDEDVYPYETYFSRNRMMAGSVMYKAARTNSKAIGAFDVMGNDAADGEVLRATAMAPQQESAVLAEAAVATTDASEDKKPEEQVQLRENLQETAFCYPTLLTDKDGNVTLSFTLPESLTTWRFMGIANSPDMLYGSIEGETVAQKDVMVQPNMPRFLRMGDQGHITARITNTSDKAAGGTARLELTDPETQQVVFEQSLPFSTEAGRTEAVTFAVEPLSTYPSLVVCKVTASGEGFSDGEQHYLPILPDCEYVTKTVPITQHEAGVKRINLAGLFPQDGSASTPKLTIEYTNNPAWLMVQSLPTLGQPWEHSAIDQAASYYSNLLAKTLLDRNPQVKSVFEQWKQIASNTNSQGKSSILQSQLSKNQELKDLVHSETPWVAAADRESEQRQRLADFFDVNSISNRLQTTLDKLQKLQNADGSFSWYPGMEGSTQVTVAVAEMLARLNKMSDTPVDGQLCGKAKDFMNRQMVELVREMKKEEKKGHKPSFPSFTALRWLYINALDMQPLSGETKTSADYLYRLLKKEIKRQTIYEKALTAVIMAARGESTLAHQYVTSLKEYSIFTEEMGRHYDTHRASYSWYDYKIPTEVAAIEALQTVTPQDRQTIDEMRRWLLQEKRTQLWDTPINSVNAIWAFLNDSQEALNSQGAPTDIAIDGKAVELPQATAGLGYVKTVASQPTGRTLTFTKTTAGTSWGAVYAQYFQKTGNIEVSGNGISVHREVMAAGPQVTPEQSTLPQTTLKVGDRIKVRITIETARDLDFVQVADRRAACLEPVNQLSGYRQGAYISPKDCATHYFFCGLAKGKHVIETEYYIDRAGRYESGTCSVQCAYAPEFRATAPSIVLTVKD